MGLLSSFFTGIERSLHGPGEFSEWWAEGGERGGEEFMQGLVDYGFDAVASFIVPGGAVLTQSNDPWEEGGVITEHPPDDPYSTWEAPVWDDLDFSMVGDFDIGEGAGYYTDAVPDSISMNGAGPDYGIGGGQMIPAALGGIFSRGASMLGMGGTAAAIGAAGTGIRTLGSIFSGAAAAATFTINGIRGTLPQLWRYTRRYGPQAVAAGLGITVAQLGAMLLSAPDAGRRRRRRGISSRDIRTTRRVVGFLNKMQTQIGCVTRKRRGR